MSINSIFESLASNNSRNFKIDLLKDNYSNVELREAIKLALDPLITFYIKKIPEYSPNYDEIKKISLTEAFDYLSDLSNRTVTGNTGIEHLKWILENVSFDDAKVVEKIIKKDLKCGVSMATANAVWNDLIHDYPCMLCSAFDTKLINKINFSDGAFVQQKLDGARFNAIVRNGAVEFYTRNGKVMDFVGNLEKEFLMLANEKEIVFDGELLVKKDGEFLDRKTGNGIIMKSQKGTMTEEEASTVNCIIWDMIPYENFIEEKYNVSYKDRYNHLLSLEYPDKISLVETHIVYSFDEANDIFVNYLSEGNEGTIIKDFRGIWENKRTKSQIKQKGLFECDLKIVGIEYGTKGSKYDGMLGALMCESEDSILKVNVGSGFSDEQRTELMKENLLDKVVSIKYNSRIVNKSGENSLFLPIFVEIREDKSIADTEDKIEWGS